MSLLGLPRRHGTVRHARANRPGPGTNLLVAQERHGRALSRAMTLDAFPIEDRRSVPGKGDGTGGGRATGPLAARNPAAEQTRSRPSTYGFGARNQRMNRLGRPPTRDRWPSSFLEPDGGADPREPALEDLRRLAERDARRSAPRRGSELAFSALNTSRFRPISRPVPNVKSFVHRRPSDSSDRDSARPATTSGTVTACVLPPTTANAAGRHRVVDRARRAGVALPGEVDLKARRQRCSNHSA